MARILIVDDEEAYRRTLAAICRREGHDSCVASTGPEAIDISSEFEPDLLIADWGLAGEFDGLELARRLQARDATLPVVLITGYSAHEIRQIKQPRLFAILEKPFGVEEVRTAVAEARASPMPQRTSRITSPPHTTEP